ncbi:MAG: cation diffusion facilitator family transporter [Acidiphilium sp.]|jgi:cation diffusion facilitator family transporter
MMRTLTPFRLALGSIALGFVVFAMKLLAWHISLSTALYSDALESLVNVAAAILLAYALRTAAKPADREHPYGHAKAELFSAVAEGGMIIVAAVLILQRVFSAIGHPALPRHAVLALSLNGMGGALNALYALFLHQSGAARRHPAIAADAAHLVADAVTTLGVLVGLGAAILFNLPIFDPIIAALVAVQISVIGVRTVFRSMSTLLDRAPSPQVTARVQALLRAHGAGAIEAHDLRMREAGTSRFLEFHLVVPGTMSVAAAHEICDRIEAALKLEMPGVVITIHVEPDGKAKREGVLLR